MKIDLLKEYLNLYWLRPESALYCTLLAKNLPQDYLKDRVSADINCGDGLLTFIANGGKIDENFNLYKTVNRDKKDIYDYFDDSAYSPKVLQQPKNRYDFGIDINKNMLYKAKKVGVFKNLIQYVGKKDLDEHSYQLIEIDHSKKIELYEKLDLVTIFSSIYMYKDVDLALKKVNSLLKKDGIFLVNIKTDKFLKFYQDLVANYPKKFADFIERDMRVAYPSLLCEAKWEKNL